MTQQPGARVSWSLSGWAGAAAILLVLAVPAACILFNVDRRLSIALVGLSAGTASLILRSSVRRRARALATLEQSATRMLGANLTDARDPSATRAEMMPVEEFPEELRPLARAMSELTDRMRVQLKSLAKQTRNLEALIDALDEPLLATDNADRVLLCSRSAGAILDVEGRSIIGRRIDELFTSDEVRRLHSRARSGEVVRSRVRVMTPLGKRTFQVSAAPVPAAWGEGVFGAVLALRDVTELDQAMQVKTDFVANASHELRTPVAAIRSAAETLEMASDDPAMSARLRGMIVSHAQRLEEMLRDLLDLSRLETPDVPLTIEHVDIHEAERTLRALSEHLCAEKHLTLSFEFEDELHRMRTDRKLLVLILRNLVENAAKFAHERTTIRVVGTMIEQEVGASNSEGRSRGTVRFEVIDQGIGIPLAHQERVFERYFQVDPARTGVGGAAGARRGTGLGLAIVKHAAKALHGRCGLKSVWGEGTTAFVEVPVEIDGPVGMNAERSSTK
jgi:two-component system phosphate regulon sensor histidine kinase PhoR